jgi:hypothetical protein
MTNKMKTTLQIEEEVLSILRVLQDCIHEDKSLPFDISGYHPVSEYHWNLIKKFVQNNTPWIGLIGDHKNGS